jgi:hypothetical protein
VVLDLLRKNVHEGNHMKSKKRKVLAPLLGNCIETVMEEH